MTAAIAHARTTDPDTSHAAALSLSSHAIRESQQEVLDTLRHFGPLTDRALLAILFDAEKKSQSPSGIRTRRSELVDLGLVVDTGSRNTAPSGRREIVWAAAA